MKQVTALDAMRDLNKFLNEMQEWCDQDGRYSTGLVSVSRETVKSIRLLTNSIINNMQNGTPVNVMDGYNGVYEQLVGQRRRRK